MNALHEHYMDILDAQQKANSDHENSAACMLMALGGTGKEVYGGYEEEVVKGTGKKFYGGMRRKS